MPENLQKPTKKASPASRGGMQVTKDRVAAGLRSWLSQLQAFVTV